MANIKATIVDCAAEDEHLVLRFGWAVLKQWKNLPADVKRQILDQANLTETGTSTVQLREQLNVLLDRHA